MSFCVGFCFNGKDKKIIKLEFNYLLTNKDVKKSGCFALV